MEEEVYIESIKIDNIPYLQNRNTAQRLNVINYRDRWGRDRSRETGIFRITDSISQLKTINFGAIQEYDIDTYPKSLIRCKGTEITYLSNKRYRAKKQGVLVLNRRFLSKILSFWCYLVDIPYIRKEHRISGVRLWCIPDKAIPILKKTKDKSKEKTYFITGEIGIILLRDILWLIRNVDNKKLKIKAYEGKISKHLYNLLQKKHTTLSEIKDRLYYVYQLGDKAWAFPKISPEYILRLLNELNSGRYYLDVIVPIIKDLHKYPIVCSDIRACNIYRSQETKDDYDLTK